MKVVVIGSGLDVEGLRLAGADPVGLPAPADLATEAGELPAEAVVFMTQEASAAAIELRLVQPGWLTCVLPPEAELP